MRISRLVVLLAPFLLCAPGCKRGEQEPEARAPLLVRLAKVVRGDIAEVALAAGTLDAPPGLDVKLAPPVAGRLARVLAAEGDRVKRGQLLANLDLAPLRDAALQAEAQLAQARAQEKNSRTREERVRQALAAGVAPAQEADDARLSLDSAAAAVRSAAAALSAARHQLARGELRAPFDGVVARLFASAGEQVDPARPVLEVAHVEVLELRAAVPPGVAMRLRPGQEATVLVDAAPGTPFEARVLAIAPVVDAQSGATLVRLRVPNAEGRLKVGSLARARITLDLHRGALLVPREALLGGAQGPAVELVKDGKALRTAVQPGYQDGGFVELVARVNQGVNQGVSEGQQVIVQGAYAVPDGTPVAQAEPAGAEAAAEGVKEAAPPPGKDGK